MIHTPLTNKAARFAYKAHHGHVDDFGLPYIFHPFHLAELMADETTTCVALLHDVVEHTDVTFEMLETEFPDYIVRSVRKLTHDKDCDYLEYIRSLMDDPVAKTVKLADLAHNSDPNRAAGLEGFDEHKATLDRERYAKAMEILMEIDADRCDS